MPSISQKFYLVFQTSDFTHSTVPICDFVFRGMSVCYSIVPSSSIKIARPINLHTCIQRLSTGGILIRLFPHSLFGDVYFHVLFYYFFCVLFVCFDFLCVFVVVLYCIVLYFFLKKTQQ